MTHAAERDELSWVKRPRRHEPLEVIVEEICRERVVVDNDHRDDKDGHRDDMTFQDLFGSRKPLIGVLHLLPLPGAPLYDGAMQKVYDQALAELEVFKRHELDSVIVENFRDMPYFPGRVPAETVAAMAAVSRDIVRAAGMPVGINVLRSDGEAAIAIAAACGAH